MVGNTHPGQPAGQCNREQTARFRPGKGETVVYETTWVSGDRRRWANPIRSKIRQTTFEAARRVVGWIARGRWRHRSQTDDRQARRVTDSSTEPGVSVACPLPPTVHRPPRRCGGPSGWHTDSATMTVDRKSTRLNSSHVAT